MPSSFCTVYILVRKVDMIPTPKYDFKTSDGEQELGDAAERGDIRKVVRLIKSGVCVNSNRRVNSFYMYIVLATPTRCAEASARYFTRIFEIGF